MTPLGLYSPGDSPLHRTPAGAKLLVLLVLVTAVVIVGSPAWLGGACVLVAAGYLVARIPWRRRVLPLLRTLLLLAVLVGALQVWLLGWQSALVTVLRLAASLAAAGLFTLTTRIDAVVATVERALGPLSRTGVRADRLGLLVGLTVQAVTTLSAIAGSVREAARARGAERSPTAFAVPFVVRTLRHADELGEALAARGIGDEDDHPTGPDTGPDTAARPGGNGRRVP
ncbi:energy-coupling factor transporter transmembrane protein EcfT [Pseudonocardia kujensis]|uniref:energy-coupling factor transporter transmembrane component T family protein n=1 Tax=Pseudonocardia kujensis TaxID=1128675 RepID=UPI001E28FD03|nr:energy-coupling factor transporter transmembrane protein EcfT [Pseudonocardia kujensis]MCE0762932.1 energy-coupling factor transporter transmembrane protein EcfT [Pseudonocardia kujensis]